MKFVDMFLNSITMYRLVLYYLIVLLCVAILFSFIGLLPYNPFQLLASVIVLLSVCWITNKGFATLFRAPSNGESSLITALILSLIISPMKSFDEFLFLCLAGILAMASKYLLALNHKHIFNPAAIAVTITLFTLNQSASWWVGTGVLFPFVLVGGFLIIKKLRRFTLCGAFDIAALALIVGINILQGHELLSILEKAFLYSPLLFLSSVMLTEPQTTPPRKWMQIIYGGIVGILFAPDVHIGSFYFTPEFALVIGNAFAFLVSPKVKLAVRLKEIIKIAPDIYEFVFSSPQKLQYLPGQYLEWTLSHTPADSRGIRRYFTIASSPTEESLRIAVRIGKDSSSFKKKLQSLKPNDTIVVSQLSGEFVLPKKDNQKYVFIAGGIGITPFRSIITSLVDQNDKRDIILFFANKHASDIVYQDVFAKGATIGLRTINILSDKESIPEDWKERVGHIDEPMIRAEVRDYQTRIFYLSGPNTMVSSYKKLLLSMGVSRSKIRTDYFPGY